MLYEGIPPPLSFFFSFLYLFCFCIFSVSVSFLFLIHYELHMGIERYKKQKKSRKVCGVLSNRKKGMFVRDISNFYKWVWCTVSVLIRTAFGTKTN